MSDRIVIEQTAGWEGGSRKKRIVLERCGDGIDFEIDVPAGDHTSAPAKHLGGSLNRRMAEELILALDVLLSDLRE